MTAAAMFEKHLLLDSEQALRYGADVLKLPLALQTLEQGGTESHQTLSNWNYVYAPYVLVEAKQGLYKRYNRSSTSWTTENTLFGGLDRLKLIYILLQASVAQGGAGLSLVENRERSFHPLVAYFPIHRKAQLRKLQEDFFKRSYVFDLPLASIRAYFGEQLAYYFAFVSFMSRWLVVPAMVGTLVSISQIFYGINSALPAFGLAMMFWSVTYLRCWQRQEQYYAVYWGMSNFLETEETRPGFKGVWRSSLVNGKMERVIPRFYRFKRQLFSQSVVFVLILIVLAIVVGIFFFKGLMTK